MFKLFYLLLIPVLSYATPSWFFNLNHAQNDIIGYGVNNSIETAKQNAMMDIANSISVNIESNVDVSSGDSDGKVQNNSFMDTHTTSKAILSGVEFVKVEHEDDLWYVAAKFDNSPIELKFKKRVGKISEHEVQNRYLKNTPLVISLNNELNYRLNYRLIRKNNLWQIKYKNIIFPINQMNFYKLFSNQNSKIISIKPNKKIYKTNDKMYFNIEQVQAGYVSILYVEHNGKVGVLLANYQSKASFQYPNIQTESAFKITNPYDKTIKELYLVIYSKKMINLAEFEGVSGTQLDESNYNFNKLITILHHYDFSSYKIKIK